MATTITPAELAEKVGSDGRTVRKFLRSVTPKEDQPGKGSRWALDGTKRGITKLEKDFRAWEAAQEAARAARAEKAEEASEDAEEEVEESDED